MDASSKCPVAPARGFVAAMVVVALAVTGAPARAAAPELADHQVTVMSYNLYLGANLQPLFGKSGPELVQEAARVFAHVAQTDFTERAQAIARLIAQEQPAIVGLQEVSLWQTAPVEHPDQVQTAYDFLAILLDALAGAGTPYRAAVVNADFSAALPISATTLGIFTDRNVVIVREVSPPLKLQVSNPTAQNYQATLPVPIGGGQIEITRGWATIDVRIKGDGVRVADTHLEAFNETGSQPAGAGARRVAGILAPAGDPARRPELAPGRLRGSVRDPRGRRVRRRLGRGHGRDAGLHGGADRRSRQRALDDRPHGGLRDAQPRWRPGCRARGRETSPERSSTIAHRRDCGLRTTPGSYSRSTSPSTDASLVRRAASSRGGPSATALPSLGRRPQLEEGPARRPRRVVLGGVELGPGAVRRADRAAVREEEVDGDGAPEAELRLALERRAPRPVDPALEHVPGRSSPSGPGRPRSRTAGTSRGRPDTGWSNRRSRSGRRGRPRAPSGPRRAVGPRRPSARSAPRTWTRRRRRSRRTWWWLAARPSRSGGRRRRPLASTTSFRVPPARVP